MVGLKVKKMNKQGRTDPLRTSGRRLTRQRRLVLDVLDESQGHLDAEAIFSLAKARDPKISLSTVYRTLSLLNEAGLVRKHSLGEDHGHFETAQSTPHYHFTCLNCQRVIEFIAPQVLSLAHELSAQEGIQVTEAHLHFSGYCPDCQQSNHPASETGTQLQPTK
jgi:Fur family transcriptional regulator, ferric uptake regulator